eukprot:CAMPEP_0185205004 /NCGR_PEP_ID=MMETSP1140-20130426/55882_1 /TAXON_ID=298111 /ORGANISM="Pavlova sp., Strain CCMP459" /LENGTH=70 /DNA_ID=CAMNT_0027772585 /DNA_START=28 /DNA_END=240 /DNA_ORIENTATION=-
MHVCQSTPNSRASSVTKVLPLDEMIVPRQGLRVDIGGIKSGVPGVRLGQRLPVQNLVAANHVAPCVLPKL